MHSCYKMLTGVYVYFTHVLEVGTGFIAGLGGSVGYAVRMCTSTGKPLREIGLSRKSVVR